MGESLAVNFSGVLARREISRLEILSQKYLTLTF